MRLPASVLQGILARAALVFLRLFLGGIFLLAAWGKLQGSAAPAFADLLAGVPKGTAYPFYQEFFGPALARNPGSFGAAVAWAQLLVGATLVVGLLTRLSAIVALLLAVHSVLATGMLHDAGYGAIAIGLLIGAAGRTFGLDQLLARRWPRSPLW